MAQALDDPPHEKGSLTKEKITLRYDDSLQYLNKLGENLNESKAIPRLIERISSAFAETTNLYFEVSQAMMLICDSVNRISNKPTETKQDQTKNKLLRQVLNEFEDQGLPILTRINKELKPVASFSSRVNYVYSSRSIELLTSTLTPNSSPQ